MWLSIYLPDELWVELEKFPYRVEKLERMRKKIGFKYIMHNNQSSILNNKPQMKKKGGKGKKVQRVDLIKNVSHKGFKHGYEPLRDKWKPVDRL